MLLLWIIFCGVCFGIWPILMSKSGFKPEIGLVLPGLANIAMGTAMALRHGTTISKSPRDWAWAMLGVILSSLALFKFLDILGQKLEQDKAVIMTAVSVISVAGSLIGGWVILNEKIPPSKLVWVALACVCIWQMYKK